MDFSKFFPLVQKRTQEDEPINDQPLVDSFNEFNDPNIQDSSELLGIEQSPAIPMRPNVPVSGDQAISEEKAKEVPKVPPIAAVSDEKPFNAIDLASNGLNSEAQRVPVSEPDFNQLLLSAQKNQASSSLINNMLKAGQTVGSALSMSGEKPDYSVADGLEKQSGQYINNVLQQMKSKKDQTALNDDKALRDPKSDISKAFRSFLAKLGIPYTEQTTAWDAKAMGINIQNLLMQQEATKNTREMKETMLGDRARNQAYSSVESGIKNIRSGSAYKAYANVKNAQDALDNAILTGDKVAAGTAFLRAAKVAQGDDSVVRSEDMKVLLGGVDYTPKAYASKMKDLVSGKNITDRELKAMQNIMKIVNNKEGQRVYQQVSPHLQKIQQSGLDLSSHFDPSEIEELSKFAPAQKSQAMNSKSSNPAQQSSNQLVERKTADGRIALFDPTTKQFVKYKDQ